MKKANGLSDCAHIYERRAYVKSKFGRFCPIWGGRVQAKSMFGISDCT